MSDLKNLLLGVGAFLFILIAVNSCDNRRSQNLSHSYHEQQPVVNQSVNIITTSEAQDGLDLQAVTALLKTVKDAAGLEARLNSTAEPRINNLDLDENDEIDYVKVDEYQEGKITGFSLSTELAEGDVQELATIEISRDENGQAQVQTQGNPQVYGNGHYYRHYGPSLTDYLIMGYIFSNHRPYSSPYGYNRYPSSYERSKPVSQSAYQSSVGRVDKGGVTRASSAAFPSSEASPNKGRSSDRIKAPLKNPTASQRAFQANNPSRTIRRGGFGSSSSRPSSSASSSSSSSSSS
ncbi:hypothetical protein JIN78_16510, partial [Roseibacillus ishigakijimensis]